MQYTITYPIRENLNFGGHYETFSDLLDVRRYLQDELEIYLPDIGHLDVGGDMDKNKFFIRFDMPHTYQTELAHLVTSFAWRYDLYHLRCKAKEI